MTVLRYPLEINGDEIPYMKMTLVKYFHQNKIFDTAKESSEFSKRFGTNLDYNPENATRIQEIGYTIVLPLPKDVGNSYSPSWEMADTIFISALTDSLANGNWISNFGGVAHALFLDKFQKVLAGKTANPKKQALFNGIDARNFSFAWTMTPTSEQEANRIQEICRVLATYTLPKLTDNQARYEFPAEFLITFHNVKGFPKLSPCVCTGLSLPTPGQMSLLTSGHLVQTELSMSFMETDLRTQDKPGI